MEKPKHTYSAPLRHAAPPDTVQNLCLTRTPAQVARIDLLRTRLNVSRSALLSMLVEAELDRQARGDLAGPDLIAIHLPE